MFGGGREGQHQRARDGNSMTALHAGAGQLRMVRHVIENCDEGWMQWTANARLPSFAFALSVAIIMALCAVWWKRSVPLIQITGTSQGGLPSMQPRSRTILRP
mmetsp:Transcript_33972/g.57581  ORF Transcript_33972/g.57581 Transcript_33972/m.57581 type:complete len:103 (+) Transcript_33972:1104-1412(+)